MAAILFPLGTSKTKFFPPPPPWYKTGKFKSPLGFFICYNVKQRLEQLR